MDIPAIDWPFRPRLNPGWHDLPYAHRMAVIAACTRTAYRRLVEEARHAS